MRAIVHEMPGVYKLDTHVYSTQVALENTRPCYMQGMEFKRLDVVEVKLFVSLIPRPSTLPLLATRYVWHSEDQRVQGYTNAEGF